MPKNKYIYIFKISIILIKSILKYFFLEKLTHLINITLSFQEMIKIAIILKFKLDLRER